MRDNGYELELKNNSERGLDVYSFLSSDGVASKNSFRDAELLLLDDFEASNSDRVLVVEGGIGVLGVVFADKFGSNIDIYNTSDRAYQLSKMNIERNSVEASAGKTAFYSDLKDSYDRIVYAPRSYEPVDLVKNRVSNLVELLDEDGELYISAGKHDGVNRYKDHLKAIEGETEKISQGRGKRIYRYRIKGNPEPERFDIETRFKPEINDIKIDFKAYEGLFSPHSLDDGSRLLIENTEISEDDKVLDLASGYGAIGLFLNRIYDCEVVFTDDNMIATHYAEKNIDDKGLGFRVENGDCLDDVKDESFDIIVSNPPTHQGSEITDEMFEESLKALNQGGRLVIVYNQNMNFEDQISGLFSKIKVLVEENNFKVLEARK